MASASRKDVYVPFRPDFTGRCAAQKVIEARDGREVQEVEGIWNEQRFADHGCPPSMRIPAEPAGTLRLDGAIAIPSMQGLSMNSL
jgi:hypothetical protein